MANPGTFKHDNYGCSLGATSMVEQGKLWTDILSRSLRAALDASFANVLHGAFARMSEADRLRESLLVAAEAAECEAGRVAHG